MNDNQTMSPIAATLVILGLMLCAIAPPVGIILLGLAVFAHRRFRRRFRVEREHALAKARAKLDREKILAAKSLP